VTAGIQHKFFSCIISWAILLAVTSSLL